MSVLKKSIDKTITSALRSMGVPEHVAKELKLEIGSDGKVVVGGMRDTALAKQIQVRLRDERGLLGEVSKYQQAEREVSAEIGGTAWTDIKQTTLQSTAAGGQPNLQDIIANNGFLEQAPELAYRLAETFNRGEADYHHDRKGVANPAGALKNLMLDAKGRINDLFNKENTKAAELSKTGGIAAMSLDNVRITMSASGEITIEGKFSNDASLNRKAESIVRAELGKIMESENTGKENTLDTAARELALMHEAKHGIIVEDKTTVLEISGGGVNAFLETETGGDTLKGAIKKEALRYFREITGDKDATVNLDGLDVDDTGKLILKNPDHADPAARSLVEELNRILETGAELYTGVQQVTGLFMASKISELMSYGPKGNLDYSANEFMDYREKSFREEAEASVKKNSMPRIEVYG